MISGSNLEKVLRSGEFAVTGELGPPKSGAMDVVRKKAQILKRYVDAVNITDCQTAIVRMSSLTAGLIALSEGVEPVMQMTCRDRNRIGMQADILGAYALGIRNLLCLTGDHQKFGNHPEAKGVFDMDSIQLLQMIRRMRDEKRFQCGEEIKSDAPLLFLGAAANPFADPFEYRPIRLKKKVDAGANFIQTQIIYNVEKFKEFMKRVVDLGVAERVFILAGVTPPKSVGMARYMKNFVPGLDVPDEVLKRLKDAKDVREEGINIVVDIINEVREIEGIAGVHVMAIEWEEAVPEIVKRAGLYPRPEQAIEPVLMSNASIEEATDKVREEVEARLKKEIEDAKREAEASRALVLKEQERSSSKIKELNASISEKDKIIAQKEERINQLLKAIEAEKARLSELRESKAQVISREVMSSDDVTTQETLMMEDGEVYKKQLDFALNSMELGLNALKNVLGLNDDAYEALKRFIEAEFVLKGGVSGEVIPKRPETVVEPAPVAKKVEEKPEKAPQIEETEAREPAKAVEEPQVEPSKEATEAHIPPTPDGLSEEEWRVKYVIRLVARGNCALYEKDQDEAIKAFEEALSIDPDNEKAKIGLERAKKGEFPRFEQPRDVEEESPEGEPSKEEPSGEPEEEKGAKEEVEEVTVKAAEEVKEEEVKEKEEKETEEAVEVKEEAAIPEKKAEPTKVEEIKVGVEFLFNTPKLPLKDRIGDIPEDIFMEKATGSIREVVIGDGAKAITVGGSSALPFYLFEGSMPHAPKIAYDVLDCEPEEMPEPLKKYFDDCLSDPVKWAQKCVSEYGAEAICLSLVSTDPNGMNRASSEAAKVAKDVADAIDCPLILWGCGNAEKDTETLREVTALITDKKVCIGPLTDANYRNLGATAMAFGLPVIAATPIDVNLAKQLNILLENLGMGLDHILMDPSIGAVGYGLEYTYSVMERIRLAALMQQDDKLQAPFICNVGREVWKAKETRLESDALLGNQEVRSILLEAITASTLLLAGGELVIMRHPKAVALTEATIRGFTG